MSELPELSSYTPPVIRFAPLSEIKTYQLSESELDRLENGSPEATSLNFALALIPTSISLVVTLLTAEIKSERTYSTLVGICSSCGIVGLFFLVRWWKNRHSIKELISEIRNRMPPPPGIQETMSQDNQGK